MPLKNRFFDDKSVEKSDFLFPGNERVDFGFFFFFFKSSYNVKRDILRRVCPVTRFVPDAQLLFFSIYIEQCISYYLYLLYIYFHFNSLKHNCPNYIYNIIKI